MCDHLEAAADRVAGFARTIDLVDHPALERGIDAVQRPVGREITDVVEGHAERVNQRDRTNRCDVAGDLGVDEPENLAGHGADRHARGRLAGAGAFEHVAHVVVSVLHRAGQICVTRARARDGRPVDTGRG